MFQVQWNICLFSGNTWTFIWACCGKYDACLLWIIMLSKYYLNSQYINRNWIEIFFLYLLPHNSFSPILIYEIMISQVFFFTMLLNIFLHNHVIIIGMFYSNMLQKAAISPTFDLHCKAIAALFIPLCVPVFCWTLTNLLGDQMEIYLNFYVP